jgi:hypothetical protein
MSIKFRASVECQCLNDPYVVMGLTVRCAKGQLVLASRSLWQPVTLAENIGVQVAELDGSSADPSRPAFVTDKLRNKRRPDGNRLEPPATSCGLEPYAARTLVSVDAEGMQVLPVIYLTILMLVMHRPPYMKHLPAKLYLLAGIEEVLETFSDCMLILALQRDRCAIEQNHPYITVRDFYTSDVFFYTHSRVGRTVA